MRVGFVTRAAANAATRVRVDAYVEPLEAAGCEVRRLAFEPRHRTEIPGLAARAVRLARWADVVVLQKPRMAPWALRAIATANPAVVVDVDDALWTWGDSVTGRFDRAVSSARAVVAGSAHLARRLHERGAVAPVTVIPSVVDTDRYQARGAHDGGSAVVAGWIGTGGSLSDFTPPVLDALVELTTAGVIRMRVVCDRPLEAPGLVSELERWSDATEVRSLQRFDIGLMPLHDDERSRGRCSFKAVQCMAVGVPVVASPVGGATEVVDDGRTGLLASTTEEWVEALQALATDPPRRTRMGAAARDRVEQEFSVQAALPRLLEVLERVRRG